MKSWLWLGCLVLVGCAPVEPEPQWWKGNLHTHSLWSDGDDYPEMILDWYKTNGYHFMLAMPAIQEALDEPGSPVPLVGLLDLP